MVLSTADLQHIPWSAASEVLKLINRIKCFLQVEIEIERHNANRKKNNNLFVTAELLVAKRK